VRTRRTPLKCLRIAALVSPPMDKKKKREKKKRRKKMKMKTTTSQNYSENGIEV
jgi:hypothetical protein